MRAKQPFLERASQSTRYGLDHLRNVWISKCFHCRRLTLWVHDAYVHPPGFASPAPHADIPPSILSEYEEARSVVSLSPRASAAMLRLCTDKLCAELLGSEATGNVNGNSGLLVVKGLPTAIQMALDIVRVVGNKAVHPGELSADDVAAVALRLFDLVNAIVEDSSAESTCRAIWRFTCQRFEGH